MRAASAYPSPLLVACLASMLCGAPCVAADTTDVSEHYTSEMLGWTMPIPGGWEVMSAERVEALESRGQQAMSEHAGVEVDAEGLTDLLNLQKDQFNVFQSSAEAFVEAYEGEWQENNGYVKDLLIETYVNSGLGVEVSDTATEIVGGVEFEVYEIVIFMPDGKELMRQRMYASLRNGYDFGASLSYNDERWGDELLRAWRASTFDP